MKAEIRYGTALAEHWAKRHGAVKRESRGTVVSNDDLDATSGLPMPQQEYEDWAEEKRERSRVLSVNWVVDEGYSAWAERHCIESFLWAAANSNASLFSLRRTELIEVFGYPAEILDEVQLKDRATWLREEIEYLKMLDNLPGGDYDGGYDFAKQIKIYSDELASLLS